MKTLRGKMIRVLTDEQLKQVVNMLDEGQTNYIDRYRRGDSSELKDRIGSVLTNAQLTSIVRSLKDAQDDYLFRIVKADSGSGLGLPIRKRKLNMSRLNRNYDRLTSDEKEAEEVRKKAEKTEKAAESEKKEEEKVKADAEMQEKDKDKEEYRENEEDMDMDDDMDDDEMMVENMSHKKGKRKNSSQKRSSLDHAVSDMAKGMDDKFYRNDKKVDENYQNKAMRLHCSVWGTLFRRV